MQGKLIAGINSRVQLYDWQLQKDSSRGLVAGAGQSGLVLALYLACRGDFIVVGQLHWALLACSHPLYLCRCCRALLPVAQRVLQQCHLNWLPGEATSLSAEFVVVQRGLLHTVQATQLT